MSNGKVVLPRKVAEAIEGLRNRGCDNVMLMRIPFYDNLTGELSDTIRQYAVDNLESYMTALVNGYEIEKSPEEKVREYYEEIHEKHGKSFAEVPYGGKPPHYFSGVKDGIKTTLDILEIKIEDINA
jgi:hypothetical protein